MRAFSMAEHRRSFQTSAENSEARCFADDETFVSGETVAFSPLPHNPSRTLPTRTISSHGRRPSTAFVKANHRAKQSVDEPRFLE